MLSQIIHNYYLRPSYKNPYFYINNVNVSNNFPTSDNQVEVPIIRYGLNSNGITAVNDSLYLNNGTDTVIYTCKATPVGLYQFSDFNDLFIKLTTSTNPIVSSCNFYLDNPDEMSIFVPTGFTVTHASSEWTMSKQDQKEQPNRYGNKSKVRMEIRYGKDNSTFQLSKVYIDYLKTAQFIRLTQDEIDEVEDTSQILEFPDYVCQEIVNELIKLLMENGSDPRLQTNIPINQSIAQPQQQAQQKR